MHYRLSSRFPYIRRQKPNNIENFESEELVQRVIIPQGLVNPGQTTVIEIPANYQDIPTVIARQKQSFTEQNKVFPKPNQIPAGVSPSQYSTGSTSSRVPVKTRTIIETTRYTEEVPVDEGSLNEKSKSFLKSDQMPVNGLQDNNGVVYNTKVIRENSPEHSENQFGHYEPAYNIFNNVPQNSEYGYLDAGKCAVVYDSTKQISPQRKQMTPYNATTPQTQAMPPRSYMEPPESNLNTINYITEEKCPEYQTQNKPDDPEEELKDVLDNLDLIESARIQRELKQFQKSRRKSIYDAANIKH